MNKTTTLPGFKDIIGLYCDKETGKNMKIVPTVYDCVRAWASTPKKKLAFMDELCDLGEIPVDSDGDIWAENGIIFDAFFDEKIIKKALNNAKLRYLAENKK